MGFGVQPISEKVAKEQQYVADAFLRKNLFQISLSSKMPS
jgi:sulfonate transport system substrate-binding protein